MVFEKYRFKPAQGWIDKRDCIIWEVDTSRIWIVASDLFYQQRWRAYDAVHSQNTALISMSSHDPTVTPESITPNSYFFTRISLGSLDGWTLWPKRTTMSRLLFTLLVWLQFISPNYFHNDLSWYHECSAVKRCLESQFLMVVIFRDQRTAEEARLAGINPVGYMVRTGRDQAGF